MRSELRRIASPDTNRIEWELRTFEGDPEAEYGFAKLALLRTTGRTLGREAGPALLVDWMEVRPEFRGQASRRSVHRLFGCLIDAGAQIEKQHEIMGVLFDPVAPSVERFCARNLKLERAGSTPFYYVMPVELLRLLAMARALGQ